MTDRNTGGLKAFGWDYHVDELFQYTTGILDSLKDLRGRVEDFQIHGDLRLNYIHELTKAIPGGTSTRRTILRHQREQEVQRKQQPSNVADFLEDQPAREPLDAGIAETVSVFAPATSITFATMSLRGAGGPQQG